MNLDEFDPSKADFGDATEAVAPEPETEASPPPAEEPAAPVEEPKAEEPKAEAPKAETPPHMIPKHRLDYIQSKRREAEQRAAELEQRLAAFEAKQREAEATEVAKPQGADLEQQLSELDQKIEEARLDGDTKAVARMLAEQRRMERQFLVGTQAQPQANPEQTYSQVRERMQFDQLVQGLERAFPQFKEGTAEFDQDLVDEVLDMHAAFAARGNGLVDSMVKAANYVLRANGLLTDQEAAQAPAKAEARKTDVAKNVKAANAQPPSLDRTGVDSDRAGASKPLDISKMSLSDFEKLSDEAIAKMRGDFDV